MPKAKFYCLFLFSFALFGVGHSFAQSNLDIALNHIQTKYPDLKSQPDLSWKVTDQVPSQHPDIVYLYLRQTYQGIEVFNANVTVVIQKKVVLQLNGTIIPQAQVFANKNRQPISPEDALGAVAAHLNLTIQGTIAQEKSIGGINQQVILSKSGISQESIPARLVYLADDKGRLTLAWDMAVYELNGENWWSVRIDAQTGAMIEKHNWVTKCQLEDYNTHQHTTHCQTKSTLSLSEKDKKPTASPQYRIYPMPIESPSHGVRSLVTDPQNTIASPFGWHDTNGATGTEYTITRGNNVYAYEDIANTNAPGYSPDGGVNLNFDFPLNLNSNPNTYIDAAVSNLFFWNNVIHDVFYQYGFNEASGNFQANNYGKGGTANDAVQAQAQDGGGLNNANFASPPDGSTPRMQMYLWESASNSAMILNSPAGVAGAYTIGLASFGPQEANVTADLVPVNEGATDPTLACTALTANSLTGKIAVIDRGNCTFIEKVRNAQNAGAIAVIIVNNVPEGVITMGGTSGGDIIIPAVMVTQAAGASIRNTINAGNTVNATISLSRSFRDGDFDNGIITHEYGHGISIRLTGGPANSSCLQNQEQMGEGWSDYFGLILTMKAGDVATQARGIGTFAVSEPTTGGGIRPAPYTTDMSINSYTYANVGDGGIVSVPHGVGFIWCSMLWDMTWRFIDRYGFDENIYNATGNKGNTKALQLVVEALKLQPCNPGFVDGRDAILLADRLLNGGTNQDIIWEAFAGRGLGYNANQGTANSLTDGTISFNLPPSVEVKLIAQSKTAQPEDEVEYQIQVKEIFNKSVSQIQISHTIPAQMAYVAGSASDGGSLNLSVLKFPAFNLSPSQTKTLTFKTKLTASSFTKVKFYDDTESEVVSRTPQTVSGTNPWRISTEGSYSGQKAWFVSEPTVPTEQILNMKNPLNIVDSTYLVFYHQYDTESNYDGGVAEISINNGQTWIDLGTRMTGSPYNSTIASDAGTSIAGRKAFSGRSNGFVKTVVNLSNYKGNQGALIRFRFFTDNGTGGNGWYVDDVYVFQGKEINIESTVCASSPAFSAICHKANVLVIPPDIVIEDDIAFYPNPTQSNLTLYFKNASSIPAEVNIFNTQGQKVNSLQMTVPKALHRETLNLSHLPLGVYIVQIKTDKATFSGRLVRD
jgi:uncharacterized repeat protein (TIGR01451 family)